MISPILELHDVSKGYGPHIAVADLSLQLAKGEFLSLLGPSGSGKTTTLMMIAGLRQPTTGEILLEQRPITPLPPYKRNIGVVFQNYALFPHMTVARNIGFPLTMRGVGRDEIATRVRGVLRLVGLPDYGGRYPRQLSGGQQQRVALARAMVFEPPLLLMDEPLGALDKKLREQMQLEIKRLHDELGMSIIYVTHDQEEALVMSHRIAVLDRGRLQQIGTPTQLYERPATRFVAEFIGEFEYLLRGCRGNHRRFRRPGNRRSAAPRHRPGAVGDWCPLRCIGAAGAHRVASRRYASGHREHDRWPHQQRCVSRPLAQIRGQDPMPATKSSACSRRAVAASRGSKLVPRFR